MFFTKAIKKGIDKLLTKRDKKMLFTIKSELLKNAISTCKESGVTKDRIADKEVVLSLTTYGKRLYSVSLTIESIMQGTMKPNRIILWLQEDLKDEPLPYSLCLQMKRGLEVRYTKDIRSYKKIIPTIKLCPNTIIVTIDDDVLYEVDTLERLVGAYIKNPHYIYASVIRIISLKKNGEVESYKNWKMALNGTPPSNLNIPIGVGGVLYPPESLSDEVVDEKTFMKLCPQADDLWLWLMAKKNGYMASKIYTHEELRGDAVSINETQDIGLYNKSNALLGNDVQFKNLIDNCNALEYIKNK